MSNGDSHWTNGHAQDQDRFGFFSVTSYVMGSEKLRVPIPAGVPTDIFPTIRPEIHCMKTQPLGPACWPMWPI